MMKLLPVIFLCLVLVALGDAKGWKFRLPGRRRDSDESDNTKQRSSPPPRNEDDFQTCNRDDATQVDIEWQRDSSRASSTVMSAEDNNDWNLFDWYNPKQMATEVAADVAAVADETLFEKNKKFADILPTSFLSVWYDRIKGLVLYKPPVGIVTIIAVLRLVVSGRIFHLHALPVTKSGEDTLLVASQQRRATLGRAAYLDMSDTEYGSFGGIEHVRRRLCWSALSGYNATTATESPTPSPKSSPSTSAKEDISTTQQELLKEIVAALDVTSSPGEPRISFVHKMISPLSNLERTLTEQPNLRGFTTKTTSRSRSSSRPGTSASMPSSYPSSKDYDRIITVAIVIAEVRMMDALLRVCRDRLLQTSHRLAKSQEHWKRRVSGKSRRPSLCCPCVPFVLYFFFCSCHALTLYPVCLQLVNPFLPG